MQHILYELKALSAELQQQRHEVVLPKLTAVVPTAITRLPAAHVSLTKAAVFEGTR